MRHALSDKDLVAKTAICSTCGPVDVTKAGKGLVRCGPNSRAKQLEYLKTNRTYRYISKNGTVRITEQQRKTWWANRKTKGCDICKKDLAYEDAHLDHDHDTGEFRGWLCILCNVALAKFGDNVEGLKRAIVYLETSRISDFA